MIKLRPISQKDTNNIIKWRNSDGVMKNFIDRRKLTKEQHLFWLKNKVNTKQVYQFIAYDEESSEDFASTYLKDINLTHSKAEFGIFIGEESYRKRGIGKIITGLTVDYGFNEVGLNKIYARVLTYNKPSYNMFLKLGFHEDARLRKDVCIDGKFYDVFIMSILKEEWCRK